MLEFADCYYQPVGAAWRGVRIGDRELAHDDRVECGNTIRSLTGGELQRSLAEYNRLTRSGYRPQLAALVFFITATPAALNSYFPLSNALGEHEYADFYALIERLVRSANLDVRLIDAGRRDVTPDLPRDAAYIVAGQVAELFFFRQDILERLLASPRRIQLYTTARAFADDGGVAGGCYNSTTGSVQLLLARIYEGFYGPAPGVAPFLHEFGHMLDHFDAGRATHGRSAGLLPGLRPSDGPIYTPRARQLFAKGKRLELERYLGQYERSADAAHPLPIGHPYVFQNDTEFIAGYLEMFLRNPHAFAAMNPDLYDGFATLFGQDPRRAWSADFSFYVTENQRFYRSGQRPSPPGLTLPQ